MTCYRVGWVCGNENIIDVFKKVKTNIDSGTTTFVQDAAVAALKDEKHVELFHTMKSYVIIDSHSKFEQQFIFKNEKDQPETFVKDDFGDDSPDCDNEMGYLWAI